MGGEFEATASIARRNGSGLAPFTPITAADPSETVGATGLADNGEAIVVTVAPPPADAARSGPRSSLPMARALRRTRSRTASHSAIRPQVAVGADGTAVAAVGVARPRGLARSGGGPAARQPRFDPPQNVSPPISRLEPLACIDVAPGTAATSR